MQRRYEPTPPRNAVSATAASDSLQDLRVANNVDACDLCGGATIEIKCKVICQNCGYTRDCSDP